MFKIQWNEKINGISFTDKTTNEIITPPRPVYYEELDLLGFNRYWSYPKPRAPLLWAIGRKYYYKGLMVGEANGGNIFQSPTIIIPEEGENLQLEPINIKKVVEKNKKALFVLENEAMDFIEHAYKVYRNKVDFFAVAFSGGKDSQVVLDIVSRILHPEDFVVVFSDTTMEIPYTYETVEKTKKEYQKKYPELNFYIVKPHKDALEFWKEFGPPSRIHRWCCAVTKSAPFVRLIKNFLKENKSENRLPNILVFDGVRAEESNKRSKYLRLAKGVKHLTQINAEVIQGWNSTEVFLYLFLRKIKLNKGYRYGLNRVGCSICPFASGWSDYILNRIEKDLVTNYLKIIENHVKSLGLKSRREINLYIAQGQWKKRAGGEGVNTNGTDLYFMPNGNKLNAVIRNPRENFLEWLKVAGDILYKKENDKIVGELKIRDEIFPFGDLVKEDGEIINFDNIGKDIIAESKIKKVLYKTAYCVHCGTCEIECPTGALKVIPEVKIDSNLCTHCSNCLNFTEKGCLVAKSMVKSNGNYKMNRKLNGFGKYLTFGIRKEWLESFLDKLDLWFSDNNLGNKQVDSMKAWLRDITFLNKNNTITELAKLSHKFIKNDYKFIWEIIWINLYYNSSVCKWFIDNVSWNSVLSIKEIVELVEVFDNSISGRTAKSGILSLFNTFEKSSLGKELKIGIIEKRGKERFVKKLGTDEIYPLAVAYSIYKAAEHIGRRDFTVSELYRKEFEGGPYKLFGMLRDKLERILRGLQEDKNQILRVDLVADLDNIYLRDDLTSLDIVKIAVGRIK